MPKLINDRTGALRAALTEGDGYTVSTDVIITFDGKGSLLAAFFVEVEEIMQYLDRMQSDMEEVSRKYNAVFGIPQSDTKLDEEIESLTSNIKRSAIKIRNKLKAIEMDVDAEKEKNETSAVYRIKQIQHFTLAKQFADLMFIHNKMQDDHRERCKERIKRELEIMGKVTTDDEMEEMLENDNLPLFIDVMESQRAKESLADVQARHDDIIKLEKRIKELHDMFIDISVLVENQGEMINNIENYTQKAVDFTIQAREQLIIAHDHQKKLRKKKIIISIVVIVIVVVVGVIIWVSVK